jgi:adenylate cyclase
MRDSEPRPPSNNEIDRRHFRVSEVVERLPADRPTHETVDTIADWLAGPVLKNESGACAIDEFAWRMLAAGFPLLRMTLHSGTLHPQFLGTTFVWWRDLGQTVQTLIAHEIRDTVPYEKNPIRQVIEGGETIRRRLDVPDNELDFSILHDLKAKGGTDYVSLRIASAHGPGYAVSYTTDRSGGFSTQEIDAMTHLSHRLQGACDTYSQRALTRNLLNAYLGSNAGPKVLAGQIRRGTGEELAAVLWSSDLRGFTERSDRLAGSRMIAILNALFEAQAKAIHNHGGEILKFIGDGLLAIFPIDDVGRGEDAAENALDAAREALDAVSLLADDPSMAGEPPLKIVVALHAGTVIYGNVGSADRLDFTVIGPAVNLVSRIEAAAKALDQPIVVSDDFARAYGKPLRSLGYHQFRGLATRHELFAAQDGGAPD